MKTSPQRIRGFSLIELMVALVAGLIVSYSVVAFTMSSMKSNAEYVQSTKMTQTLRNTLDMVVRDLRRAGYDDNALARLSGGGDSPFGPMLIVTSGAPSPTSGSCAIYGYDRPGGTAGVVDVSNGEVRGVRRVTYTRSDGYTIGVIEYAVSADVAGTPTRPVCSGARATYSTYPPSCNATSLWCPLTDAGATNIRTFTLTETSLTAINADVRVRNVSVAIQSRLVGDVSGQGYLGGVSNSVRRGLLAQVKVRSDCVRTTIANCNVSP